MPTGDVAGAMGKGLVAGVAGTVLMTLSSTTEMKLTGRAASSAPAYAAAKVLGVEARGEAERARFSNVVHWPYGTTWGAIRGLVGLAGLTGPPAAAHFVAVWGTGLIMLPALGVAPPGARVGGQGTAHRRLPPPCLRLRRRPGLRRPRSPKLHAVTDRRIPR